MNTVSVSQFLDLINEVLVATSSFWIEGEVGIVKNWRDSWFFFTLKEGSSVLECNMSAYRLRQLGIELKEGQQAIIAGGAELKKNGRFSFNVHDIKLKGEGELKKQYEQLKKRLEAEGLFSRKRELKDFPSKIAVITSRSGAVWSDFKNNLKKWGLKISFYDSQVEGERAIKQIVNCFNKINNEKFDLVVLMRGGGSWEDLRAFNDERVVKAVFQSKYPVICAVGHDADVPLSALVADRAVSTPTAAAMLVNSSYEEAVRDIRSAEERLLNVGEENIRTSRRFVSLLTEQLDYIRIKLNHRFQRSQMQLETIFNNLWEEYKRKEKKANLDKMFQLWESLLKNQKYSLSEKEKQLQAFNPTRPLRLGYSLIFSKEKLVKKTRDVVVGDKVKIKLSDGNIKAKVEEKNKDHE
jgi:exodeoxyribonuclease VII large subunit